MTKKKDGGALLREDLEKLIYDLYKIPSPLRLKASASSTGVSNAQPYNSLTVRGAAGGAWASPSTAKTGTGFWSGTAGSVTLSTLPEWVVFKQVKGKPRGTSHLQPEDGITTLCGKEKRVYPYRNYLGDPKPPANMQCKTCQRVFEKQVLEGRYEG